MWKTFQAEWKWIFASPWRIIELVMMFLIPTIYGFLYLNAYWNPFQNVAAMAIKVVNYDADEAQSAALVKTLTGPQTIAIGSKKYHINLEQIYDLNDPKTYLANDHADALIAIPAHYVTNVQKAYQATITKQLTPTLQPKRILQTFDDFLNSPQTNLQTFLATQITKHLALEEVVLKFPKLAFYNSHKHNFLAGVITNFGASLANLLIVKGTFDLGVILKTVLDPLIAEMETTFATIAPQLKALFKNYQKQPTLTPLARQKLITTRAQVQNLPLLTASLRNNLESIIDELIDQFIAFTRNFITTTNVIKYYDLGANITTYGYGLSPYFISIAIWAGALVMLFMFKNIRRKGAQHIPTMQHYFGKSLVWISAGWIQTTILISAITLQGVNLGANQWMLYLFAYFTSTIFCLILQALGFLFRYGDLAEFCAVILLVIQLTSSSGTFPVAMQAKVFQLLHPLIPFTYTIATIRELFYEPSVLVILKNCIVLTSFLLIMPFAIFVNYRFDQRHQTYHPQTGQLHYPSYEIHLGDK